MPETALAIITLSWGSPIGLGVFFIGIGVLWWVSLQTREKKE
jgi:hypothetical protein